MTHIDLMVIIASLRLPEMLAEDFRVKIFRKRFKFLVLKSSKRRNMGLHDMKRMPLLVWRIFPVSTFYHTSLYLKGFYFYCLGKCDSSRSLGSLKNYYWFRGGKTRRKKQNSECYLKTCSIQNFKALFIS